MYVVQCILCVCMIILHVQCNQCVLFMLWSSSMRPCSTFYVDSIVCVQSVLCVLCVLRVLMFCIRSTSVP